jgi:flagellar biosynthesis protein FlhF
MQIKTFRALNMRDALYAVKTELGPEAVILSTQEIRTGNQLFGIFSRTVVEVTAAVDHEPPRSPRHGKLGRPAQDHRRSNQSGGRQEGQDETAAILSHGTFQDQQSIVDIERPFSDYMQRETQFRFRDGLSEVTEAADNFQHVSETAEGLEKWKSFEADIRSVRRLVGTLVKNERDLFVERLPEPLRSAYDRLLRSDLDPEAVMSIVQDLQESLPFDEAEFPGRFRDAVRRFLCEDITYAGTSANEATRPMTVMVVGPSGVGKTTTIAKIAADFALHQKRKVALITLDTYRVAAVEQLRTYGNILGLAVDVALTCEDLQGLLRQRRGADLILIDTAGRSHLDHAALQELKKLGRVGGSIETHLVLSAATRETDSEAIVSRFAPLPVTRLIFSKLDETNQYGGVVNVLRRSGLALSYLSAGQRVPEDLAMATPNLLADLLLDGVSAIKTVTKPSAFSSIGNSGQRRVEPGSGLSVLGRTTGYETNFSRAGKTGLLRTPGSRTGQEK